MITLLHAAQAPQTNELTSLEMFVFVFATTSNQMQRLMRIVQDYIQTSPPVAERIIMPQSFRTRLELAPPVMQQDKQRMSWNSESTHLRGWKLPWLSTAPMLHLLH